MDTSRLKRRNSRSDSNDIDHAVAPQLGHRFIAVQPLPRQTLDMKSVKLRGGTGRSIHIGIGS